MKWDIASFVQFFSDCHGVEPFDWQRALADHVLGQRKWPDTIAVPTGCGKTAVLDIALFALAAQADLPHTNRTSPRRIVFVVDRRIVVDSTADRAERIRRRIETADTPTLKAMRDALGQFGGETPLHVATLRGGVWRDERWARTPTQPTVLVSTVDQVGSRLLFRGYGLSPHAWPIHAGLLAHDALIILDEAHLSRAFEDTLEWVRRYRELSETLLKTPFAVVRMTATPRNATVVFPDRPDTVFTDPRLKPRLERPKWARLIEIGKNESHSNREDYEKARANRETEKCNRLSEEALSLASAGAHTVAVVVNRVATARSVFQTLEEKMEGASHGGKPEVILLTGRSRPIERDALIARWRHRLLAGERNRDAEKNQPPLIVVATQCIEVGADFDFDAMVTECCPLDSLRQRLGRVNRLGHLNAASVCIVYTAPVVLKRAKKAESSAEEDAVGADPVYGEAVEATWKWLRDRERAVGHSSGKTKGKGKQAESQQRSLDLCPAAPQTRPPGTEEELKSLLAPAPQGPIVFPAYCDIWAQTSPLPEVSPDPAVFLHGPRQTAPEVQIVWRADLDPDHPETWRDLVAQMPPMSSEALPLRLWTARSWLAGQTPEEAADQEGQSAPVTDETGAAARRFLIWRGDETREPLTDLSQIRPGDTIVVPASYGGCDPFGWNPKATAPVRDFAEEARIRAQRPPRLRIDPAVIRQLPPAVAEILQPLAEISSGEEPVEAGEILQRLASLKEAPDWLEKAARQLAPTCDALARGDGRGVLVISHRRWSPDAGDFVDDSEESSQARQPVGLFDHSREVADLGRRFATACGLPADVVKAIEHALRAHDWGKADPRFQAMLCGGDLAEALKTQRALGQPLAKAPAPATPDGWKRARQLSGYPDGARHELVSVRLLKLCSLPADLDCDLVLHLVASHHGRCRPFAPVVQDPDPVDVELTVDGHNLRTSSATGLEHLDSGVAERFWALVRRYGWWGLAYLEAIARLADHRASEMSDGGAP